MTERRDPIVLDGEAAEVIRRCRVALVATRSAKARPFMTPLWFASHRGAFYLGTGHGSWAGRNVAGHPETTMLFGGERGQPPGPTVRLRGLASCEAGVLPWPVLLRFVIKYYLPPRSVLVELRHRSQWPLRGLYHQQSEGGAGYLRVVPTAVEVLRLP